MSQWILTISHILVQNPKRKRGDRNFDVNRLTQYKTAEPEALARRPYNDRIFGVNRLAQYNTTEPDALARRPCNRRIFGVNRLAPMVPND